MSKRVRPKKYLGQHFLTDIPTALLIACRLPVAAVAEEATAEAAAEPTAPEVLTERKPKEGEEEAEEEKK